MALFTARAPQEKHFIIRRPTGYGLPLGRHVRVIGDAPAWLIAQGDETSEAYPSAQDDIFTVDPARDEADARMVHATTVAAVQPDRRLTSNDLQRKIPAMKDATHFHLATSQLGFPEPLRLVGAVSSSRGSDVVEFAWSEAAVDRWLEAMRAKAKQIQEFI